MKKIDILTALAVTGFGVFAVSCAPSISKGTIGKAVSSSERTTASTAPASTVGSSGSIPMFSAATESNSSTSSSEGGALTKEDHTSFFGPYGCSPRCESDLEILRSDIAVLKNVSNSLSQGLCPRDVGYRIGSCGGNLEYHPYDPNRDPFAAAQRLIYDKINNIVERARGFCRRLNSCSYAAVSSVVQAYGDLYNIVATQQIVTRDRAWSAPFLADINMMAIQCN